VPARTETIEEVRRFPNGPGIVDCDLIPDETTIVCSVFDQKADAWLMNDFDPDVPVSTIR
jgi:hypothetical protein